MWDAQQYLRFGGERARPFFDLIAQVGATDPGYVADLGCGPGNLTAVLAERWPGAAVTGVDNSAAMIDAARASTAGRDGRVSFELCDVWDWRPDRPVDVLVCNAVLQWVPGHQDLLLRWADLLAPGGWLAFQLPGNFDQPSHAIVGEMAKSGQWRALLAGAELNRQAGDPAEYAALLARPGYQVDAWETTYLHILTGAGNPVLEWTKGSTLRPVLARLGAEHAAEFLREYGERVLAAYRPHPFGTIFPFRRVFTVLHRTGPRATPQARLADGAASRAHRADRAWGFGRLRNIEGVFRTVLGWRLTRKTGFSGLADVVGHSNPSYAVQSGAAEESARPALHPGTRDHKCEDPDCRA